MRRRWLKAFRGERGGGGVWWGGGEGGSSHDPCDGAPEKVLVAESHDPRHGLVALLEGLGHDLHPGAQLDETVQLDARTPALHGVLARHGLCELGTDVVAHLDEGCGGRGGVGGGEREPERAREREREREGDRMRE
ncbi:hypothetical protein CRUP_000580, partial [Coryphaenoides rupestris]